MENLSTVDKVREYIGHVGTTLDGPIGQVLAAVSWEVQNWCGQPILKAADNVTHAFWGTGATQLILPYFPVDAVGELSYVTVVGGDAEAVPVEEYVKGVGSPVFLWTNGALGIGRLYSLKLTVGYAEVPPDVEQVALEMCAVRLRDSGIGENNTKLGQRTLGLASKGESVPGQPTRSTVFNTPNWQERLAPYRVVLI